MEKYRIRIVTLSLYAMLLSGCIACSGSHHRYSEFTPEKIVNGSGLTLPKYKIQQDINDKDLIEDGWGLQGWLLEISRTYDNKFLDSLVRFDERWEFQNDVRQQYFFYEKLSDTESRSIYIGKDNDPIMSVSYLWKK